MNMGSKHIVESMIDFMIAINGRIEVYLDKVVIFSTKNEVNLDETLTLVTIGFCRKQGVGIFEGLASVSGGFEVYK